MKTFLGILILTILLSNSIRALEKEHVDYNRSNRINLNIQSNFFSADYGTYSPLNPGVEFLYEFVLTDKIAVLSGANYIYSRWRYDIHPLKKYKYRTFGHELFLPLLLKYSIGPRIHFETGVYSGYLIIGKVKYMDNWTGVTKTWKDVTDTYASNQTFSADLFAGLVYSQPFKNSLSVEIVPFAKLKLIDNWLEQYRTKSHFGVKINFSIDTKNLFKP